MSAAIAIPPGPAGMVIIAEIQGLQIYPRERLKALFDARTTRNIVKNGTAGYRVVPDTLDDGLILDVPQCADYARPFNLGGAVLTMLAEINFVPVPFSVTLVGVPIRAS